MEFPDTSWTLIQLARNGDRQALNELSSRYWKAVLVYLRASGLKADAEDIAQETIIRLISERVLARADPSLGRFRSLVLAVSRNALGHYRERARAEKRGGGQTILSLQEWDVTGPVTQEEEERFNHAWVKSLLELCFARLAKEHPNYHAAVRLVVVQGKTQAAAATRLKKSLRSVQHAIYRGKRKLVEYLEEELWKYSSTTEEYHEELSLFRRYLPLAREP